MTFSSLLISRRAVLAGTAGIALAAASSGTILAQDTPDITDADAYARQQAGDMIIVDIRTPPEWAQTGIARDAHKIDMQDPDFVQKLVDLRLANPDREIGLICASSNRSGQAQRALSQAGFDRLYSVYGGMTGNGQVAGWVADGLPTEGCC